MGSAPRSPERGQVTATLVTPTSQVTLRTRRLRWHPVPSSPHCLSSTVRSNHHHHRDDVPLEDEVGAQVTPQGLLFHSVHYPRGSESVHIYIQLFPQCVTEHTRTRLWNTPATPCSPPRAAGTCRLPGPWEAQEPPRSSKGTNLCQATSEGTKCSKLLCK